MSALAARHDLRDAGIRHARMCGDGAIRRARSVSGEDRVAPFPIPRLTLRGRLRHDGQMLRARHLRTNAEKPLNVPAGEKSVVASDLVSQQRIVNVRAHLVGHLVLDASWNVAGQRQRAVNAKRVAGGPAGCIYGRDHLVGHGVDLFGSAHWSALRGFLMSRNLHTPRARVKWTTHTGAEVVA